MTITNQLVLISIGARISLLMFN